MRSYHSDTTRHRCGLRFAGHVFRAQFLHARIDQCFPIFTNNEYETKLMQRLLLLLIFFITITPTRVNAQIPRLFLIKKEGFVAFVLPITHVASRVERDAYLQQVILPALNRSDIFYDESVPRTHIIAYASMNHCDEGVAGTTLHQTLLDHFNVMSKRDRYKYPAGQSVSVFSMFSTLLVGPISPESNVPPISSRDHPKLALVDYLADHKIERASIETISDWFHSYCELPAEQRAIAISEALILLDHPTPDDDASSDKRYLDYLRKILASLGLPARDVPIGLSQPTDNMSQLQVMRKFDRFLLYNRNLLWLKKIDEMRNVNKTPFLALGAAHLAPNDAGKGLFDLLRKQGFSISLVSSANDIPAR